MTESISFVGSAVAEDNYITITDDTTGERLRFAVYEEGDGLRLDMGDIGEAVVGAVEITDIITALETIYAETESLN